MKTKIFGGIAIVAIAVAVALNVNMVNKKSDKASLLALANVEALAQGEIIEVDDPGFITMPLTVSCSKPGQPMQGGLAIYCIPGGPNANCQTFDPCKF